MGLVQIYFDQKYELIIMSENLEKTMESFGENVSPDRNYTETSQVSSTRSTPNRNDFKVNSSRKWQIIGDGDAYRPCGETVSTLPNQAYKIFTDEYGNPVFQILDLQTDSLFRLPDSQTDRVLNSIEKFWDSKQKFVNRGFLFKRGILLTGAPGGGKTTCIQLLTKQLLDKGGIVVLGENPYSTGKGLETLRKIEPERPLICILEDLDELVHRFTEAEWLALLDGENQINNIVFIGTTNYPQKLDRRFVNRPSRFDEIIEIPMPSTAARRAYLEQKIKPGDLNSQELDKWVLDSEGFSVAHLRELYVSVFCLDRNYDEVISRLRIMQKVKFKEFDKEEIGFGAKK